MYKAEKYEKRIGQIQTDLTEDQAKQVVESLHALATITINSFVDRVSNKCSNNHDRVIDNEVKGLQNGNK